MFGNVGHGCWVQQFALQDAIAHNSAITACGDVAQWQLALQLLKEVDSIGISGSLAKLCLEFLTKAVVSYALSQVRMVLLFFSHLQSQLAKLVGNMLVICLQECRTASMGLRKRSNLAGRSLQLDKPAERFGWGAETWPKNCFTDGLPQTKKHVPHPSREREREMVG